MALMAEFPSRHCWPRALCEKDASGSSDSSVAVAAGREGEAIYRVGAYSSSGLSSVDAYLTRKAGMFPDVVERLALNHIARGDQMSALITSEWCAFARVCSVARLTGFTAPQVKLWHGLSSAILHEGFLTILVHVK